MQESFPLKFTSDHSEANCLAGNQLVTSGGLATGNWNKEYWSG